MAKRDYILHNFWWKITSLLLAIIVWFVVYANTTRGDDLRRTLEFPRHSLAIMRDSADKRPVRITPTEVTITVSVSLIEANNISDSDIQTFIDLNEIDVSHKKARIRVYVPQGVRLESITPEEAAVEILEP